MGPENTNSENLESEPMTTQSQQLPDIDELRHEIDRLDAEILAAVKRRTEVSQEIGKARMASGGTRLVHSREMKVLERYSELGRDGKELAMLLLRLGRGRLGH
ncbi:chorismate mutase [Mycolicibacter sinensis]|uniref:Chorismate mutase n=1 Tax=Mycolicibacter sinensis (strain JDM601) TaxID=875328 RepID=A0A1A3TQI3_MYCSD|nr:chorismate mutase [Mycolicibacter sinensis]MDD7811328.1 chorismate mutase [Mycobacterium sp. CSUR Q5927]OBK84597.1 chorismate mutase [Mycolicibacter sinensis]